MLLTYHRLGGLGVALWAITILVCLFLLVPIVFIAALSFGSSQWLVFPPPAFTPDEIGPAEAAYKAAAAIVKRVPDPLP